MKNVTKILALACVFFAAQAFGQTPKFGHVNIQEVVMLTAESDSARIKLDNYAKDLEETLKGMQQEFSAKYETYNQKSATWTAAILETKTKELQEMQARLTQYQENAQSEYGMMQQQLFAPIYKKAGEVIEKIGKEGGFIYIFDLGQGGILFKGDTATDVTPLAKKALNIPDDKKLPVAPQQQQN